MKTLRHYQWDAVLDLAAYASDGHKSLGLVAPTGSGKSVILAALMAKTRPIFTGVVVAAPSVQIEDNFKQDWHLMASPDDIPWSSATASFRVHRDLFLRLRDEDDKRDNFTNLVSAELDTPFLLTTHQQLARWGCDVLPEDLTGKLLILDEGHHAGTSESDRKLNTKIGDFGVAWETRGGTVIRTTATPFRTDQQDVFPEGTKAHVWTISDHSASGYAPDNFEIQTVLMDSLAESARQYAGEELSADENNGGTAHEWMVKKWVEDGKPKAVFIVPSKRSRRFTKRLLKALQDTSPGVRVVDAVGIDPRVAQRLQAALEADKEVFQFDDSLTDVVIACRRFDEGTDWPLCSHVYNYGIPRSFGLILQRWGRAFRDKSGIAGHPHPDIARITFFVPQVADEVLAQFEKQHHDHAFLLACYMADWEAAKEIRADLRIRMERNWARRPEESEEDRVARIRAQQSTQVPDHVRLEMQARLAEWALQFESQAGVQPNIGQLRSYLSQLALSPVQHQAGLELAGEFVGIVGISQDALPIFEVREDYIAAWNKILDDYRDQTYTEATRVLAVYSAFTGKDAKDVVGRLTAYFDKPDLTEDMIVEAAKRFHGRKGRWPNQKSGDASLDFGFPETWIAINHALYRGKRGLAGRNSLAQVLHDRGLKYNVKEKPSDLTEDEVAEAAQEHHRRTGRWPGDRSGDAFDDIGFSTSWNGINQALVRGVWGLPGGKSLPQLLHERGLKPNKHAKPSDLTEGDVVSAAGRFYSDHGEWPTVKSGDASGYLGFSTSWNGVSLALNRGRWGLPGGKSLLALLQESPETDLTAKDWSLTEEDVIDAAKRHHRRTGRWPNQQAGDAEPDIGLAMSWSAVDHALSRGSWGLPGGQSLGVVLHEQGLQVNAKIKPTDLTEDRVVEAARHHFQRTRRWPKAKSGDAEQDIGFSTTWASMNRSLAVGLWGLPGGSSLARLLHARGLKVNDKIKPHGLTEEAVVQAALKFHTEWGVFPETKTPSDAGPYIGFHTSWQGLNLAVARGKWGLPGGSSLAQLLHERGLKRNRKAKTPFVPADEGDEE